MNLFRDFRLPHDREIWKSLANRIGGEFIEGDSWENDKVVLKYRERTIILNSEMKSMGKNRYYETEVKCLFTRKNTFTLKIFLENAFTHAGKILGINDIELDDSKFDDEFYVKSNNKNKALNLLNSDDLKSIYFAATKNLDLMVSIEIKDNDSFLSFRSYPPNTSTIVIRANMIMQDMNRLISWFNLCKITLDRLIEIGEAEDISPQT